MWMLLRIARVQTGNWFRANLVKWNKINKSSRISWKFQLVIMTFDKNYIAADWPVKHVMIYSKMFCFGFLSSAVTDLWCALYSFWWRRHGTYSLFVLRWLSVINWKGDQSHKCWNYQNFYSLFQLVITRTNY